MKNQKLIKMEKFIEKEKERIYMMKELFQSCMETHFNLNPLLDEATKKRMNSFLTNAISSEIDLLYDDTSSYIEINYPEII
jgi:DNA repair photolyase